MKLNYLSFVKEINNFNFFEKKAKIAVGVSGGVDSISLLFLLSLWAKIKKFEIIAIIIDHKLRAESSNEAKNISLYLSKNKINNIVLVWNNNNPKTRIQENARIARLNIIEKYCFKNNIIHLFFGHHLDDDIETYVIRKISGSDIEGLNSIKPVNQYKNILIHRPLLKFKKNEIIQFAKKNNLESIDDPSNYKMFFSRSKVRFILKNNNKIKNNLIKELNVYKEVNSKYIEMINLVLAELIIFANYNIIVFNREIFINLPIEIAYRVLIRSVSFINSGNKKFKYHKLMAICKGLLGEISVFQTQKTLFVPSESEIKIFLTKYA